MIDRPAVRVSRSLLEDQPAPGAVAAFIRQQLMNPPPPRPKRRGVWVPMRRFGGGL